jgi:hypothetical protein
MAAALPDLLDLASRSAAGCYTHGTIRNITAMQTALEAAALVLTLSAVNVAMIALYDLLVSPMSWWRKAAWSLLVLSLPLVGPVVYYRCSSKRAPEGKRRTESTHKEGR